MSVDIGWYIEKQVIKLVATGEMKPGVIRKGMEKVAALIDTSDAPLVHILVDVRAVDNSAMRLKERVEAVRPVLGHARCGWVVMVGQTNLIANFLSTTSAQIFKIRFRSFKTLEEGIQFLQEMLPEISASQVASVGADQAR